MKALALYAGPVARRHLEQHGLAPADVQVIPGAAGGPKGLILGPLDRFVFGDWLSRSHHPLHLIGASIGAWRMATACLPEPAKALAQLEHDYIHQDFQPPPGQKRPTARQVSEAFAASLQHFYGGRIHDVLNHPRFHLHVVTSRGRGLLAREGRWTTPLGYAAAFLFNVVQRRAMGAWLQRVVFSSRRGEATVPWPFDARDYASLQLPLHDDNFMQALQASCSIPFVLQAVHDIAGAPTGAYWDGGITDYHLHLNYKGLVLYPHFQQAVVPGWLDKSLKWRHKSTAYLDNTIVLAPNPEWVKTLPNGKLPDRTDFFTYGSDLSARVKVWNTAVAQSQQLVDEFHEWLVTTNLDQVKSL